jgi:hypothetical protein
MLFIEFFQWWYGSGWANPGRSLDAKMRAMIDNLISRTVGFFVRIFSLLAAIVMMSIAAVIGLVVAVTWPLIPVLIIISAIKGVI